MATTVVVRIDISGTSFVLDVSTLELTASLSTLDFEVTHNGVIVSSSYAKTSQTQLTYTGTNITLGTKIIARRVTSVVQSETTFLSTTTASALTNALEKERLRIDELDARLSYTLAQVAAGGITIGSIPVSNVVYGAGWDNDTTNAPSKNAVYDKILTVDTAVATKADAAATSAALALLAPLASPPLTGNPTAPTPATADNDTSIATTAYVKAQHPTPTTNSGEKSFSFPNGVLMKVGFAIVTVASNVATVNYSTSPGFTTITTLVLNNGDTSVTTSGVGIQTSNTSGFVLNTPTYAAGNFRVNFLAIGT